MFSLRCLFFRLCRCDVDLSFGSLGSLSRFVLGLLSTDAQRLLGLVDAGFSLVDRRCETFAAGNDVGES